MTVSRIALRALAAATAMTAFAAPAAAQRIDRIVAFGDSAADVGNAFEAGFSNSAYLYGRFSNGTNYIDTLSNILQVPVDNFAIGGALGGTNSNTFCPGLPQFCTLGFQYQVDEFLSGGGANAAGQPQYPAVDGDFGPNDLVTVSIGINDTRRFQALNPAPTGAQIEAAAQSTADAVTTQLDRLVAAGAPTISYIALDASRVPEVAGNAPVQTVLSDFFQNYDASMRSTLAGYAANGTMVHYLDTGLVLDRITADPAAYGLVSASNCPLAQATRCVTEVAFSNQYLFYVDRLHLSSTGFAIMAKYVATQLAAPMTLSATSDVMLDTANQFGRTLTTRMDLAAPRDGDMPEGARAYLVGDSVSRRIDEGPDRDSIHSSSKGVTLGADYGFGSGLIGAAINFSWPEANFGNDAAASESRTTQFGVYGGLGLAGGFVQAYGGIGSGDHELTRRGVIDDLSADIEGKHTVAGIKAGWLMPIGDVRLGPVAALDYAKVKVDGYTEDGDAALALNVDDIRYRSLRGSLGAELRGDFGGNGVQLRPYAAAVIEKDFKGDDRTFLFSQTSAPTIVNRWDVDGSKKAYARFTTGGSAQILANVGLDLSLSTTAGKEYGNETSAHLGVKMGF